MTLVDSRLMIVRIVKLLPKGDHANKDDALLEAEGVLVLVVRARLVAAAFAVSRYLLCTCRILDLQDCYIDWSYSCRKRI